MGVALCVEAMQMLLCHRAARGAPLAARALSSKLLQDKLPQPTESSSSFRQVCTALSPLGKGSIGSDLHRHFPKNLPFRVRSAAGTLALRSRPGAASAG